MLQLLALVLHYLHETWTILLQSGIPLGAIPIGLALGLIGFGTIAYLVTRPSTDGAGTQPISVVLGSDRGKSFPGNLPVHAVRLFGRAGSVTVQMRGAGEHPSLPLPRARGFVIALFAIFIALAGLILWFYRQLFGYYDHVVALVGSFIYFPKKWPGVYAVSVKTLVVPDYIFPMYLAGMLAFFFASGLAFGQNHHTPRRRVFAILILVTYVGVELVLDALFFTVPGSTLRNFALIVRAFTGGLFMALLTFCAFYLPKPQRVDPRFPRDRRAIGRFAAVGAASVLLAGAALLGTTTLLHVEGLDFDFTILLLLPLLTLVFFCAIGRSLYFRQLRAAPLPSLADYHPTVSIVMPAYNEEEWIEGSILAADRAAAGYPGAVEIIVGNDGSTDRTLELARRAMNQLQHTRGVVVDLPHGGKSNALNGALAVATGEIVLRCDGDTAISESPGFAKMISHFADPRVGGVQGALHPRQKDGWTRKLRALEIAWMHYFLRPAGMGTRSAEVIDGLFSAFRRKDLVELGGWVPWNGEDTEIAMRIQRLGYLIRIEFGAIAFEDVPGNYDALRRQRVRWARGIVMANGQHYTSLFGPTPEFCGLAVFFWFVLVVRSGVRSLVYVFLALLIIILGVRGLEYAVVLLGLAILLRALPLGYFLVKMHRADVLPWILFFPFGNIIKQTFRFEAYGTLGPRAAREYI